MAMRKTPPPTFWRRLSQVLFLVLFLVLFVQTDYQGKDELSGAINLLFRIDPLIGLSVSLTARSFVVLIAPSMFLLLSCFLAGRWFCGWACPMGTLLDASNPLVGSGKDNIPRPISKIRHGLLVIILVGALFGLPLVGYFDPFAILVRGLTMSIYPAFSMAVEQLFTLTYQHGPPWLNFATEPLYRILRDHILPFEQKIFTLALPAAIILLTVFLMELFQRRFFCRNICPLGALLGMAARLAPWRIRNRQPGCRACGGCSEICRTGAIDDLGRVSNERCILCLDCLQQCPNHHFDFGRAKRASAAASEGLSRRALIGTIAAGIAVPFLFAVRPLRRHPEARLLRPPGARPEGEFLGRCVRCGECMQVCIGNALHPTFAEAGVEGMFTPRLIPRIGYCEYQCTLCGQVCPTGAIERLPASKKQKVVIGRAFIDRNRCLPYAKGIPCIVCEEHCPTPQKAIRFRSEKIENEQGTVIEVKQPYVIDSLCIGCGICENKCPLPGKSAILVTSAGESRHTSFGLNESSYIDPEYH